MRWQHCIRILLNVVLLYSFCRKKMSILLACLFCWYFGSCNKSTLFYFVYFFINEFWHAEKIFIFSENSSNHSTSTLKHIFGTRHCMIYTDVSSFFFLSYFFQLAVQRLFFLTYFKCGKTRHLGLKLKTIVIIVVNDLYYIKYTCTSSVILSRLIIYLK